MLNYFYSIESFINDRILGWPLLLINRWWHILLKLVIIVGVLVTSAYLGYRGTSREIELAMVVVPAVLGMLVLYRWPQIGLVLVIITLAIPYNGPSNSNATMALVAMLMGLWIFEKIYKKQLTLVSSITIKPLLVFVVIAILAFGMGQLPWYTFVSPASLGGQLGGLSLFILSAGAFLLVADQVRSEFWLQVMVWVLLAIGAIFIASRLISPIGNVVGEFFPAQATGSLLWVWLAALAFSQAMLNNKLHPIIRLALMVFLAALMYEAVIRQNDWKSGWLPPLAVIAAIVGIRYWQVAVLMLPFGVLPAAWVFTTLAASDSYSYSTRIDAWKIVLEISQVNPILGLGPANYRAYTVLFPIRGYAVEFNSHSQFIDLIAQTGILGLLAFIWFFLTVTWVGLTVKDKVPKGFAVAYVYGALGGVAGIFVAAALGDWVIPFFYNITLGGFRASVLGWLFLGGLIALARMYAEPPVAAFTDNAAVRE